MIAVMGEVFTWGAIAAAVVYLIALGRRQFRAWWIRRKVAQLKAQLEASMAKAGPAFGAMAAAATASVLTLDEFKKAIEQLKAQQIASPAFSTGGLLYQPTTRRFDYDLDVGWTPDVIVAWRTVRVGWERVSDVWLARPVDPYIVGMPIVAECGRPGHLEDMLGLEQCDEAPGQNCPSTVGRGCGWYAFKDKGAAIRHGEGMTDRVLAKVELSGRVIEHTRGYRAQVMRLVHIEALSSPPSIPDEAGLKSTPQTRAMLEAKIRAQMMATFPPLPALPPWDGNPS